MRSGAVWMIFCDAETVGSDSLDGLASCAGPEVFWYSPKGREVTSRGSNGSVMQNLSSLSFPLRLSLHVAVSLT